MVATLQPPQSKGPGAPKKADPANVNVTFALTTAERDALDRVPRKKRRGYIRRAVKRALRRDGLLDGPKSAGE